MKKSIFLIPLFLFADVDPFAAGLNSSNPYGLTPDEKFILKNKKEISNLKKKVDSIAKDISTIKLKMLHYDDVINNRLAAFPTFIDELNTAMTDIEKLKKDTSLNKQELEMIKSKITSLENKITSLEVNITQIKKSIEDIVKTQNENFNNLKKTIMTLLKEIKSSADISPKEAFSKAKVLFFSDKLDKAKELFLFSLSKNYLPATSSYYLGEIAFKKGNYKEALAFYKKSVNFYPKKTSYMARLLYHTAISFEKLGDKNSTKLTLQKLLNDFPNSKYAKLAKKELEKLK